MTKEMTLIQQLDEVSKGICSAMAYAQEIQALSQVYMQSIAQAMAGSQSDEWGEMLRSHRKLRKAIAGLEKTDREEVVYQCGIFAGAYRALEEVDKSHADQEGYRKSQNILGRKHVRDILDYLYRNPDARQGKIAEDIGISPSHLSEILDMLLSAGYVNRYGKHKDTRYCLTKAGRRNCRTIIKTKSENEDIYIDVVFEEIIKKEKFWNERVREDEEWDGNKEDAYAKWNRSLQAAAGSAGY